MPGRAAHPRPHCSNPPGPGSRVWSLKHVLECTKENVRFISRERERREQTQNLWIGGGAGEKAMLEKRPLHLCRGATEVQPQQQTFATDPPYFRLQCALREVVADIHRVFDEMFPLDNTNVGQSRGTRQRSATKRTAEITQRERCRDIVRGNDGSYRQAGGETLGERQQVGGYSERFRGREGAAAADPALHLVEDQQSPTFG